MVKKIMLTGLLFATSLVMADEVTKFVPLESLQGVSDKLSKCVSGSKECAQQLADCAMERQKLSKELDWQESSIAGLVGDLLHEKVSHLVTKEAYKRFKDASSNRIDKAFEDGKDSVTFGSLFKERMDSLVAAAKAGASSAYQRLVATWEKGDKEKAAIIVAGALVTVATGYGLYRVATSKKAKKLYAWFTSSQGAEEQAA